MLDYVVLYRSQTGNTKKIATQIFTTLPGMSKDLIDLDNYSNIPEASTYFVGFCVHHGTCDLKVGEVLGTFSEKNVAIFGTCGIASCSEYYQKIEKSTTIWLESDNFYLGAFFCQGKMSFKIRQKFESKLSEMNCDTEKIKKHLQNFDEAIIHPNEKDLKHASSFTKECLRKLL